MRDRRAYGRPGTAVFPPGWDTSHAAVVDATHNATVIVGPPGGATQWNSTTRQTETVPADPVYQGSATIEPAALTGRVDAAEEMVDTPAYAVTLQRDAHGIQSGHVVHVGQCSDPDLAGRDLTVDAVALGTDRFARHLTCTLT